MGIVELGQSHVRLELERHIRRHPLEGTPEEMRAAFAALAGPQPEGEEEVIGGVPCRRYGRGPIGAIWLHGGGYVFGGPESHGACASQLAAHIRRSVILPVYRLAPENPWPAQLHDAAAVIDALGGPVPVVGDSAGGHLALNLAFARPGMIPRLALLSPNTDRTDLSESREAPADLMNDDAQDRRLAALAFDGMSAPAEATSPLHGPLHRLPPTMVSVGADEVLLDDSLLLARAAALQGVPMTLLVLPRLIHMWWLWPQTLGDARTTIADVAAFLSMPGA